MRLVDFKQTGSAHTATDAHRNHDALGAASFAFDERVSCKTRTTHSIRMTDRDRSAIDIELFRIDAKPIAAIDHLHGESFVQFPEIDIGNLQAMPLQEPGNGKH